MRTVLLTSTLFALIGCTSDIADKLDGEKFCYKDRVYKLYKHIGDTLFAREIVDLKCVNDIAIEVRKWDDTPAK